MTLDELIPLVYEWGYNKGIAYNSANQALVQLTKTEEEITELIAEIDAVITDMVPVDRSSLPMKLEMGDILVTLIMTSSCLGIDLAESLELAYNKINKRTGEVVDGIFVKDS